MQKQTTFLKYFPKKLLILGAVLNIALPTTSFSENICGKTEIDIFNKIMTNDNSSQDLVKECLNVAGCSKKLEWWQSEEYDFSNGYQRFMGKNYVRFDNDGVYQIFNFKDIKTDAEWKDLFTPGILIGAAALSPLTAGASFSIAAAGIGVQANRASSTGKRINENSYYHFSSNSGLQSFDSTKKEWVINQVAFNELMKQCNSEYSSSNDKITNPFQKKTGKTPDATTNTNTNSYLPDMDALQSMFAGLAESAPKENYYYCTKNEYTNQVYLKLQDFISEFDKFTTMTEDLDMAAIESGGDLYSGFLSDIKQENKACKDVGSYIVKVKSALEKINEKEIGYCQEGNSPSKSSYSSSDYEIGGANDPLLAGLDDLGTENDPLLAGISDSSKRVAFSGGKSYNSSMRPRSLSNGYTKYSGVYGAEAVKAIYLAEKAYEQLFKCFQVTYNRAAKVAKKAAGYDDDEDEYLFYGMSTGNTPYNSIAIMKKITNVMEDDDISQVCSGLEGANQYTGNSNLPPQCSECNGKKIATEDTKSGLASCLKAIQWNYEQSQADRESARNNNYNGTGGSGGTYQANPFLPNKY